jgi:hypothetical protein
MRSVAVSSLISTFVLVACQGRAEKVNRLLDQYNAEYPGYARTCLEEDTSGAARLLTGQTLTAEQIAALEAKKKERDARCKPEADRLAQLQREILAAQQ